MDVDYGVHENDSKLFSDETAQESGSSELQTNDSSVVSSMNPNTVRVEGQVTTMDVVSLSPLALASAQLSRLAYTHRDGKLVSELPDDLRRAILPEYPPLIQFGSSDSGVYTEGTTSMNDTGQVPYVLYDSDVPSGMLIYTPLVRDSSDMSSPVVIAFRGTDNLFDLYKDLQLITIGESRSYSRLLHTYLAQIFRVMNEKQAGRSFVLTGHSLGGKIAFDLVYLLLNTNDSSVYSSTANNGGIIDYNPANESVGERLLAVNAFNPFLVPDAHFKTMFAALSLKRTREDVADYTGLQNLRTRLRSLLTSHIINGDPSMNQIPIGNQILYGAPAIGDGSTNGNTQDSNQEWKSLEFSEYLMNSFHSIDNFTVINPPLMYESYPSYQNGQQVCVSTASSEILPQYHRNEESSTQPVFNLQLIQPGTHLGVISPTQRYLSCLETHSAEIHALSWFTFDDGQYSNPHFSTLIVEGKTYVNRLITLVSGISEYNIRILPALESRPGEHVIEEVSFTDSLPSFVTSTRVWTAPSDVWYLSNSGRFPLNIEFIDHYGMPDISINPKHRWTLQSVESIDPGHRRRLEYIDPFELFKTNNDELIFEISTVGDNNRLLMANPFQPGKLAMVFPQSDSHLTNSLDSTWRIQYDIASNRYKFTNTHRVDDTSIQLGNSNIYYHTKEKSDFNNVWFSLVPTEDGFMIRDDSHEFSDSKLFMALGRKQDPRNSPVEPLHSDQFGTNNPVGMYSTNSAQYKSPFGYIFRIQLHISTPNVSAV